MQTKNPSVFILGFQVDKLSTVLRSAMRAPAKVRQLNISDVIFYCSVGERSRALALLNAAQVYLYLNDKQRSPNLNCEMDVSSSSGINLKGNAL